MSFCSLTQIEFSQIKDKRSEQNTYVFHLFLILFNIFMMCFFKLSIFFVKHFNIVVKCLFLLMLLKYYIDNKLFLQKHIQCLYIRKHFIFIKYSIKKFNLFLIQLIVNYCQTLNRHIFLSSHFEITYNDGHFLF